MPLTSDQARAAEKFTDFLYSPEKVEFAITGSPGSGKTYLTQQLAREAYSEYKVITMLQQEEADLTIELTATTNAAAGVLSGEVGSPDVTTVYSKLGIIPRDNYKTGKTYLTLNRKPPSPLPRHTLLVVDEASMLSPKGKELLNKQAGAAKILYLLDKYQLPPVDSSVIAVDQQVQDTVELTEIVRNSGHIRDMVLRAKHGVMTNTLPSFELHGDEFCHVDLADFEGMIQDAVEGDDSFKVLSYDNTTAIRNNRLVRQFKGLETALCVGDRVKTNKPIINNQNQVLAATDTLHEIVSISEVITHDIFPFMFQRIGLRGVATTCVVPPEQMVNYKNVLKQLYASKRYKEYFHLKNLYGDLRDDYASTVHKAQGSSYDRVFVDLSSLSLCRNTDILLRLLYVAISRARKQVVFTGSL